MGDLTGKWGVLWRSNGYKTGLEEHLIWDWTDDNRTTPKLFRTRREAREWRDTHYGYIRHREDLRSPPHNWQLPKVVKVRQHYEVIGTHRGNDNA